MLDLKILHVHVHVSPSTGTRSRRFLAVEHDAHRSIVSSSLLGGVARRVTRRGRKVSTCVVSSDETHGPDRHTLSYIAVLPTRPCTMVRPAR